MPAIPLYRSARLREIEKHYQADPLMQRAGAAAAAWAAELALDRPGSILVCAGPGNNGGDAFEAAHRLRQACHSVTLVVTDATAALPEDAAAARERFLASGGTLLEALPESGHWRLIIDGLFGIGLKRPPEGKYAHFIIRLNQLADQHGCPLLALDCPSGLNADTGQAAEPTIHATHTLSFIAAKPGLLTADGPDHCGALRIDALTLTLAAETAEGSTIAPDLFAHRLRSRRNNTHKGHYGRLAILGGAHAMLGAVFLAGRAALQLGAGRVFLGLLAQDAPPVDFNQPELMIRRAESLLGLELDALACGPGMGTSLQAAKLLEQALSLDLPLVLDADALNLLALEGNLQTALAIRHSPTLLTPHPSEAARLLDVDTAQVSSDRIAAACEIASRFHCPVILKGCGSIVAAPEGRWWINTTGNPGLATAGTGDVLTGIAASLFAQGWHAEEVALAAPYLHGAAADTLVAAGTGPVGMTAGELIPAARSLLNHWMTHA